MHNDRILIVDDEPITLDFFEVMLSKLGFVIDRAENGEEALAAIMRHAPDLIILDNNMPRMSGWELTTLLKQDPRYEAWRTIPVVMFSAMDDLQDKIEGYELGIEDYITKPFNFSEVLARIKAVLRNRDLAEQLRKREKRLAIIDSLNRSLVYFAGHVKEPVSSIFSQARDLPVDDPARVREFLDKVITESETILATIEGLEDEIRDQMDQEGQVRGTEVTLESLEEKYLKHFRNYQEKDRVSRGGQHG